MKDSDYIESLVFRNVNGYLEPVNEKAIELLNSLKLGETVEMKEVSKRDIKFHRAYFDLIHFVYDYLPQSFKDRIPKEKFYLFLKELQGRYKVLYKFKDGREMKEYQSIAFDKMSQIQFRDFVREQITIIYDSLIRVLFDENRAKDIIDTIEEEYKVFLSKL